MAIAFSRIPNGILRPGFLWELDGSLASGNRVSLLDHTALLMAPSGAITESPPDTSGSPDTDAWTGTLLVVPVAPNTISGTYDNTPSATPLAFTDDGVGGIIGDATGTINYATGEISISSTVEDIDSSTVVITYGENQAPYLATSANTVREKSGAGSILHNMAERYFKNNAFDPAWIVGIADLEASAANTWTVTYTGTATASGEISLYVGGRLVRATVVSGDTATVAAAAVDAAVAAADAYPVTAANAVGVLTLTSIHSNTLANGYDVRHNYNGEELPAGITATVLNNAAGTGTPTAALIQAAFDKLGDTWVTEIAWPYTDSASLTELKNEMFDREGPDRQIPGVAFAALEDTAANVIAHDGKNSEWISIDGVATQPSPVWEVAAAVCAVVALSSGNDPARPYQTLPLIGILGPAETDRFTAADEQSILESGHATTFVDTGGTVRIQVQVSTYTTTALGAPDDAWRHVNTAETVIYLSYDWVRFWLSKYARVKLGKSGVRYGAGQQIMTVSRARLVMAARYALWEEQGLVEDLDGFLSDSIVEIDGTDPNRLNFDLRPRLMNGLRVGATIMRFIL